MRRHAAVVLLVVTLLLGACGGGGGDDDGGSSTSDVAGDATTTTAPSDDEAATTSSTTAARTDIKPCELLTKDELEAQASVANVQAFEEERQEQAAANLVRAGAFRCTHYFNVLDDGSEITATLAIEVRTADAAGEYKKLHDFGDRDRQDVAGLGDKAFFDVENGSITVLAKGVVLIVDPGMPGVIEETNRPVAEAVAKIVPTRL
jgi:hypothetical protein